MVTVWSCHLARPVPISEFTLLCSGPALQGHLKGLLAPFQNFGVLGVFMKLPCGPHLSEDSNVLQQLLSWVWISDTPTPGTCRLSGAPHTQRPRGGFFQTPGPRHPCSTFYCGGAVGLFLKVLVGPALSGSLLIWTCVWFFLAPLLLGKLCR